MATALSLAGVAGGITLAISMGQPILAVFGIIVALAPWGALIDDIERGGGDRDRRD